MDTLTSEYVALSNLSMNTSLSDQYIFEKISEFDKKYNDNKAHFASFEGLLCNVGADQKSINILKCVIKRLKEKKDRLPSNKYHYDIANAIEGIANIESPYPHDLQYLIDTKRYKEARYVLLEVENDDLIHYERARTNIANLLDKYGRNYEALYTYDSTLDVNPNFGMALGNKAIALIYYTSLAPQQSLVLLNQSYMLLKKALEDESLTEVGGNWAKEAFSKKLFEIERYFEKIDYTPLETKTPKELSPYNKFILENNLILNYDFGYYYDEGSLKDNFFPNLVESTDEKIKNKSLVMSDKIYFCFNVFNQIMEDFVTARYNYFHAIQLSSAETDCKTEYIYTFDYSKHSVAFGMYKSVFSTLYNSLDKIAHLVNYYFTKSEIEPENVDIYFDWFTTEEYKNIILENDSYQLLALFSLALDFKTKSPFNRLQKLRNRITHSFLNISDFDHASNKNNIYETNEMELTKSIDSLFIIVKSAIIYTILAIKFYGDQFETLPMLSISQDKIFK